ncbi:hypothetical protein [Yoonia sediminilitoris]|uniref:hypothetical protein n=1 Tax=Yoonia sediminilitoris TaxID=1286148 RepID=UPI001FE66ABC|nr:hypothetical protein [Yoonia sediminilitoris]
MKDNFIVIILERDRAPLPGQDAVAPARVCIQHLLGCNRFVDVVQKSNRNDWIVASPFRYNNFKCVQENLSAQKATPVIVSHSIFFGNDLTQDLPAAFRAKL